MQKQWQMPNIKTVEQVFSFLIVIFLVCENFDNLKKSLNSKKTNLNLKLSVVLTSKKCIFFKQ